MMKKIFCLLLLSLLTSSLRAQYNPDNPEEPGTYTLTLVATPSVGGIVAPDLQTGLKAGDRVTCSATANRDFYFVRWMAGDSLISDNSTFEYVIPAKDMTLVAVFQWAPENPADPDDKGHSHQINLTASPIAGGYFDTPTLTVTEGDTAYVQAYANVGFTFKGWQRNGETISIQNPLEVVMGTEDINLTATFTYTPDSPGDPFPEEITDSVPAPVIERNGNMIGMHVSFDGAVIHYTMNGSTPDSTSTVYKDSIAVTGNCTIKAIALHPLLHASKVVTFEVNWFKCEKPVVAWNGDQMIATTATDGAIIQYSLTQPGVETPLDQGGEASPLKITVTQDAIITLYAVKTGWTTSDTLVIDYPYTAWHELLIAVDDANTAIQQVASNDNVPQQMLNELKNLTEEAQAMYSQRTAEKAVIQNQSAQIRDLTDAILQLANAQPELYAVLEENSSNGEGTVTPAPHRAVTAKTYTLKFYYDGKKAERNGMDIKTFGNQEARPWHAQTTSISNVVIDASMLNNTELTSTAFWFYGFANVKTIEGLQNLNTVSVTDMTAMFRECSSIEKLDVSTFNTSNLTKVSNMFSTCSSLKELNLRGFKTNGVTDMSYMFDQCSSLTTIDLSEFNTENVKDFCAMFQGCSGLTSLDVTGFNTSNATRFEHMFNNCKTLTSLDVTRFNTENANKIGSMFQSCESLTAIDVSGFNTSNVTDMNWLFANCFSLETVDLSSFNTEKVTNMDRLFYRCRALTTVYVGSGWTTVAVTSGNLVFNEDTKLVGGKGTAFDANHIDYTYAHIDGGPTNPGYFTDKNAPVIDYAFDENGVLTVGGSTTLADALDAAGGRDEVAKRIAAIVWNSTATLTNSDLQGLDNPNMLVYVQSESLAPKNRDNVVIGNDSIGYTAKNIVLRDVESGNNNFYCPQAFTAEMISYTRNFQQRTQVGVSCGWETIALPFTVQTIMHEKNGVIAPFGNDASTKHFWLRQISMDGVTTGLTQATKIEANTPYLISMPNNAVYPDTCNQAGRVTFSSQNVEVPVTRTNAATVVASGAMVVLYPTMQRIAGGSEVYVLNVGGAWEGYAEGSVFVAGLRDIRPFEAYTVHNSNSPAPRFVPIKDIGGTTGILTSHLSSLTSVEGVWYDLNGRKLQQKPTRKGVYILNGTKVVIK